MTTQQTIPLAEGERYIGGIVSANGITTHLILLPGSTKTTWKKAMAWAAEQGGDLPNRVEQALLFATAKEEFEEYAYWSNMQHAFDSSSAWYQGFIIGTQVYDLKSAEVRARAVRRLVI